MTGRWTRGDAAAWLRRPGATDDKYRRGVLGVRTGSAAYPGAAVLGVSAAWRTGTGMLRFVPALEEPAPPHGLPTPAAAVLAAHPETVFGDPAGRPCDAWLVGSGTDPGARSAAERAALERLLRGDAPVVADAGALAVAADAARSGDGAAPTILTPHRGEFLRLWESAGLGPRPEGWPAGDDRAPLPDAALADAAARLAERLSATVLLKGSVTAVATPGGWCRIAGPATSWLATAGTGDVLAGVLAALVAAHAESARADPETLGPLGASAAVLHDAAARLAARDRAARPARAGGRPITARDVADAIPAAWGALRARSR